MAVGFLAWAVVVTLKARPEPTLITNFNEVCVKVFHENKNESFVALEANFNIKSNSMTDEEVLAAFCTHIQSNEAFSGSNSACRILVAFI